MQRRNLRLAWLLVAAFVAFPVGAEPADIVLMDPVRIAFFEQAPRALERSMRSAIKVKCKNDASGQNSPTASPPWYCAGTQLRFLREVNVLGEVYQTGLACHPDDLTPNLKYYLEDMFDNEERCISVAYDVETKRHFIEEETR